MLRKTRWNWLIVLLLAICAHLTLPSVVWAQLNEHVPDNVNAPGAYKADFIVLGDAQGSLGMIWPVAPAFDDMVNLVNQVDAQFAIQMGDRYVGGGYWNMSVDDQIEDFMEDISALEMPWYPVMGNHDALDGGWDTARETFFAEGNTYYSFDSGDSHFIILDAYMPGYNSTISGEQMAWLVNDLKMTEAQHIFVFVHPPVYPLGWHVGSSLDTDEATRDRLASLLVEYNVDVVFCGHEHFYASFEYRGLMQVTTGSAGAKLRSPADFDDLIEDYGYALSGIMRWKTASELHYTGVKTIGDRIEISAYDMEGNIIDNFTIPS